MYIESVSKPPHELNVFFLIGLTTAESRGNFLTVKVKFKDPHQNTRVTSAEHSKAVVLLLIH